MWPGIVLKENNRGIKRTQSLAVWLLGEMRMNLGKEVSA
jgi:hypothetical protein